MDNPKGKLGRSLNKIKTPKTLSISNIFGVFNYSLLTVAVVDFSNEIE